MSHRRAVGQNGLGDQGQVVARALPYAEAREEQTRRNGEEAALHPSLSAWRRKLFVLQMESAASPLIDVPDKYL